MSDSFFPLSRSEHASIKLQNKVAIRQRNTLALYQPQNGGPK